MNLSENVFLVQGLGIIGILASVLSFQSKEHKKLLILKTVNELLFAAQYILLAAYTGAAMNLIGCVRNVIFAKMVEKKKNTSLMSILFSAVFLVFTAATWAGAKSILIGIAKVISTIAYGNKNVFLVRVMILTTSIAWFIYNLIVKSYAGCICEMLTICSIIVGLIRIDIPQLKNKER